MYGLVRWFDCHKSKCRRWLGRKKLPCHRTPTTTSNKRLFIRYCCGLISHPVLQIYFNGIVEKISNIQSNTENVVASYYPSLSLNSVRYYSMSFPPLINLGIMI